MRTLILASALLLAACSSQTVEPTRYYLLRSPVDVKSGQQYATPDFVLGRVEVATYIDQPGLVLETASGEVHMARLHQWAEPLRVSLRRFLASEIGVAIDGVVAVSDGARESTRIDVSVDQLHGDNRGQAVLVAYWQVVPAEGEASSYQFSESRSLNGDGYGQLAAAEQSLLRDLARRIGESL